MHRDRLPCCFQITVLWSPHSKGIWNSRLLVVSRSCQVPLISLPFTWHPAGVYLCSHILVWNSEVRERGAAMRGLGSPAHSQLLQDFVQFMPKTVQTPLSCLAGGFGYLAEFQAGSTALSLHGGLEAQQCKTQALYSPLCFPWYDQWWCECSFSSCPLVASIKCSAHQCVITVTEECLSLFSGSTDHDRTQYIPFYSSCDQLPTRHYNLTTHQAQVHLQPFALNQPESQHPGNLCDFLDAGEELGGFSSCPHVQALLLKWVHQPGLFWRSHHRIPAVLHSAAEH